MIQRFSLFVSVHVLLIRDGQILLLRRCNTGYADGMYGVVAGHLDGNEEIKAAAAREAFEEAGIQVSPADLEVVGVMHTKSETEYISDPEYIGFFLLAMRWTGEIVNTEPEKCDELAWFDLDRLPSMLIPYVRRGIENYRRGVWFESFGWGDEGRVW